jgi:hypothetical protein
MARTVAKKAQRRENREPILSGKMRPNIESGAVPIRFVQTASIRSDCVDSFRLRSTAVPSDALATGGASFSTTLEIFKARVGDYATVVS